MHFASVSQKSVANRHTILTDKFQILKTSEANKKSLLPVPIELESTKDKTNVITLKNDIKGENFSKTG